MRISAADSSPPQLGNRFTRTVGRWFLAMLGWHIEGKLPNVPKMVAIGAPHTRNYDVVIGLGVILALGVRISWMAKHTVFQNPFGAIMQKLGGLPINRTARFNVVDQMVQKLQDSERLILVVMPEGSRSRAGVPVNEWRTGFYYIALGANIPITPVYIDNAGKRVIFGSALTPTGNKEDDFAQLQTFYSKSKLEHSS